MIVDTFMWSGETSMLEFRLRCLDGKVRWHVVAEADQTHLGVPRPLWLPGFLSDMLPEWRSRVIYVPVSFPESVTSPWQRENYQRDQLWHGLGRLVSSLAPTDTVLLCDVDEIPSDAALAADLSAPPRAAALKMRTFHSAVDWEYLQPQLASVITVAGNISWPDGTASKIRGSRPSLPVIEDGGWHFTWVGTQAYRERKLSERTCHGSDMGEQEAAAIRTGATYRGGEHAGEVVRPVDVDSTWPEPVWRREVPECWWRPR